MADPDGVRLLALVLALPWVGQVLPSGPWTILRSPARQVYITTFGLAAAAGVASDWLVRWFAGAKSTRVRPVALAILALALLVHFIDLRTHTSAYLEITPYPGLDDAPSAVESIGDGRIAVDTTLIHSLNRRIDDVGVFDSILLAKPYRALTALAGWTPRINRQIFDGSELGWRALAWSAGRSVVSVRDDLPGLNVVARGNELIAYDVPASLPRAGFVPESGAHPMEEAAVYDAMRAGAVPNPEVMYLSPQALHVPSTAPSVFDAKVTYERPTGDTMHIKVASSTPGFLRVIESWDPGWHATVDGQPTDILLADGFVMAVPLKPGSHEVRLDYSTLGATAGLALSALALALLGALVSLAPRWLGSSRRN
jgi:hypothetical protein